MHDRGGAGQPEDLLRGSQGARRIRKSCRQSDSRYVSWFLARYQDSPNSTQELRDLHQTMCGGGRLRPVTHYMLKPRPKSGHYPSGHRRGDGVVGGRGPLGRGRPARSGDHSTVPTTRSSRSSAAADPSGPDTIDAQSGVEHSGPCRLFPAGGEVSDSDANASPSMPDEVKSLVLDCIGHEPVSGMLRQ